MHTNFITLPINDWKKMVMPLWILVIDKKHDSKIIANIKEQHTWHRRTQVDKGKRKISCMEHWTVVDLMRPKIIVFNSHLTTLLFSIMHKDKKKIARAILFMTFVCYLTLMEGARERIMHPVNVSKICTECNKNAICFEFIDVQNLWTSFIHQFLVIYSYLLLL